jgi:hypothetical protein
VARLEHMFPLRERGNVLLNRVNADPRVKVMHADIDGLKYIVKGDGWKAGAHGDGLYVDIGFDVTSGLLTYAKVLVYPNPSATVVQRFNRLFKDLPGDLVWYHRTKQVQYHLPGQWLDLPVEVLYQPTKTPQVLWRADGTSTWADASAKPKPAPPVRRPAASPRPVAPVAAPSTAPAAPAPSVTPVAPVAMSKVHGDPNGLFKFPVLTKKSEVVMKAEDIEDMDAVWASHSDGERECIAIVGPTGTGKTSLANNLAARHDVGIFTFDAVGAREFSDWVGTTHLRGDQTVFIPSGFPRCIDADGEYAGQQRIVLIDEVTRAESTGALNTLVPVLHDFASLYVPELGRSVAVDPAVLFILTANIGYAGTVTLDLAFSDRVTAWVEMKNLDPDPEKALVVTRTGLDEGLAARLCLAANQVRGAWQRGELPEGGAISTRRLLIAARRAKRGMSLQRSAYLSWLRSYSEEGGTSSERTIVKSAIDGALRGL